MDRRLSEDQRDLLAAAVAVLEKYAPPESIDAAKSMPGGFDRSLHQRFVDLGWTELGHEIGEGSTIVELGLVLNKLGYFGTPSPLRSTMSAAYLAARVGPAGRGLLSSIAGGDHLAVIDATGPGDPDRARLVEWGAVADAFLVVTSDDDTIRLIEVPADDAVVTEALVFDGDATADVSFDLKAQRNADTGAHLAAPIWQEWRAVDRLLRCAELLGAAERSMTMAVDNAKTRHQFGRPIGAFQAVQHHAADMRMDVEAAALLTWSGLWRVAAGHPFVRQSLMAAWQTSESAQRISQTAVQVHGGLGFMKEYPLHHFYRRTKAQRLRFGAPRDLQRELADSVIEAALRDFHGEFVAWPNS